MIYLWLSNCDLKLVIPLANCSLPPSFDYDCATTRSRRIVLRPVISKVQPTLRINNIRPPLIGGFLCFLHTENISSSSSSLRTFQSLNDLKASQSLNGLSVVEGLHLFINQPPREDH